MKLLRQYGRRIGVSPSFTIIDRADAEDLMGLVRHDLGLADKGTLFPKKDTCLAIYSLHVNSLRSLKAVLRQKFPTCRRWRKDLGRLLKAYEVAKRTQNVLDYDDLLRLWLELLQRPKLAKEIGGLFDHVLVDEYQDTNRLQAKILLALKPDGRGLTVVGDDAQSIYSFRAADVRNILDFPKLFDPEARVITLEQNYRSTQPILKACNEVIGLAKERFTKNLFSKRRSAQKPFMTTVRDGAAQMPGDDNDGDHLILSTIHSAKGQEWKHVYILNVIDGCIPHARAGKNRDDLEEERRLLYVAMTRAKDELDLVVPQFHFSIQEMFGGDMKHLTKASKFIPKRFEKYFERRVPPSSPHKSPAVN